MDTWRGMVVIVFSAVVASVAMIYWLLYSRPQWKDMEGARTRSERELVEFVSLLEFAGVMYGSIFIAGRAAAGALIGKPAADEIATSSKWYLVPIGFVTGVVLIMARVSLDDGTHLWTREHLAQLAVAGVLIISSLHDAWVNMLRPFLARAKAPPPQ